MLHARLLHRFRPLILLSLSLAIGVLHILELHNPPYDAFLRSVALVALPVERLLNTSILLSLPEDRPFKLPAPLLHAFDPLPQIANAAALVDPLFPALAGQIQSFEEDLRHPTFSTRDPAVPTVPTADPTAARIDASILPWRHRPYARSRHGGVVLLPQRPRPLRRFLTRSLGPLFLFDLRVDVVDQLRQHDAVHLEPFVHAFDAVRQLLQLRRPRVEQAFEGVGAGGQGVGVRYACL